MSMDKIAVTVPYDDFVIFVSAKSRLDAIRKMIESGDAYCSSEIKFLAGVEEDAKCTYTDAESVEDCVTPEN